MKLFRADRIRFSTRIAADMPNPASYSPSDRHGDFASLFGTVHGRRVLAQILVQCQLWERSYTAGDSHETARREGMRDVGLWIMELINLEPVEPPAQTEHEEPDG